MFFVVRDDVDSQCLGHVTPFTILNLHQFTMLVTECDFIGSDCFNTLEAAQWWVNQQEK